MSLFQFWKPAASTAGGILAAGVMLAGCVSSPEPQETVRSNLQTAPADLQLLCASAAASSTGVESSKVLPVSSQQLDLASYQVDLNVDGNAMRCVVNNQGLVTSVQPSWDATAMRR